MFNLSAGLHTFVFLFYWFAWYHNSGKVNNSAFVTMKRRPRCPDILGFNINNPSYVPPPLFPITKLGPLMASIYQFILLKTIFTTSPQYSYKETLHPVYIRGIPYSWFPVTWQRQSRNQQLPLTEIAKSRLNKLFLLELELFVCLFLFKHVLSLGNITAIWLIRSYAYVSYLNNVNIYSTAHIICFRYH